MVAGIDLASQPVNTGLCMLGVGEDGALELLELRCEAARATEPDNAALAEAVAQCARVAIDAPFGWPEPFAAAVAAWRTQRRWPGPVDRAALRRLRLRCTDLHVGEQLGKWPLSVSADSIAVCAMRCCALLGELEDRGLSTDPVDGRVVEIYPGASLIRWGLKEAAKGYKRDGAVRARVLSALEGRFALRGVEAHRAAVADDDDLLDALICAILAAEHLAGRLEPPDPEAFDVDVLRREGWIWLPGEDEEGATRR